MTTTIQYIDKHVIPVLEGLRESLQAVETHLATLNGRTDHLEDRSEAHTGVLKTQGVDIVRLLADVRGLQTVAEVTERFRDDQIEGVRDNTRTSNARLWQLAGEVAKMAGAGGVAAIVLKVLEAL